MSMITSAGSHGDPVGWFVKMNLVRCSGVSLSRRVTGSFDQAPAICPRGGAVPTLRPARGSFDGMRSVVGHWVGFTSAESCRPPWYPMGRLSGSGSSWVLRGVDRGSWRDRPCSRWSRARGGACEAPTPPSDHDRLNKAPIGHSEALSPLRITGTRLRPRRGLKSALNGLSEGGNNAL